jgi:hypothetical protein
VSDQQQLDIDQQSEIQASSTSPRGLRSRPPNGTRAATREPIRNGEWLGRGGEVLTRGRTNVRPLPNSAGADRS